MTAPYQVFVDGSKDRSPGGIARVAAAMAARYGLPPAELETRLSRGRFKVKAGIDRATAETYARDLDQLGAIVVVVDASGATVDFSAKPAVAKPALGVPPPRTGSPLPSSPPPRAASGPLPARAADAPARAASGPLASLAGAKSGAAQDLGALGRDDGAIALASLDGEDEPIIEPTSLSMASFGPAPTPASRAPTPAPRAPTPAPTPRAASEPAAGAPRVMTGPPVDLFAAPDSDDDNMELAIDVVKKPAGTTATQPARTMAPPLAPAAEAPVGRTSGGPSIGDRARDVLGNARIRFAAGVLVAVLIGFIPATIVASVREGSAYAAIDTKLRDRYAAVASDEEYAALDGARASALETKYAERREIALIAVVIWAAVAGGLAYVWFRRVPWDQLSRRPG